VPLLDALWAASEGKPPLRDSLLAVSSSRTGHLQQTLDNAVRALDR
jgi:hypothetical protein